MRRLLLVLACLCRLEAQPQLRLELGFHNGVIKSLATDAGGRFFVTASDG